MGFPIKAAKGMRPTPTAIPKGYKSASKSKPRQSTGAQAGIKKTAPKK